MFVAEVDEADIVAGLASELLGEDDAEVVGDETALVLDSGNGV